MDTIIIGMGNPVLSDDAVGLEVARRLAPTLAGRDGVDVVELHCGGLRLMEAMAGYRRAVVVDAILTEGGRPGTVYAPDPTRLWSTRNTHSTHDASLPLALELGKAAGLRLPTDIRIWAVEAGDVETVREGLTADVERAVAAVVANIIEDL